MRNAHLRMGKVQFVRRTRDTVTNVSVGLDRLVAEPPRDSNSVANLHLASVFGGDQEMGATLAAVQEGLQIEIALADRQFPGTLGETPAVYRASVRIPGRKRPPRHAVILSRALFETAFGADGEARRTILVDGSPEFVLHRLAVRFGLPVLPEWAPRFHSELLRRGLVERLTGLNCRPIAVTGTKRRLLRILSQGLKRGLIEIPPETRASGQPFRVA